MDLRDVMDTNNRKGSFTAEAALIFPIFILLWIPFLYFIRYIVIYETVSEDVHQAASVMAYGGYLFQRTGLKEVHDAVLKGQAIRQEETKEAVQGSEEWMSRLGKEAGALRGALQYCHKLLDRTEDLGSAVGQEAWKTAVNWTGQSICSAIINNPQGGTSYPELGISEGIHLDYSEFFYTDNGITDWISVIAYVPVKWPDPFQIFSNKTIVVSCSMRAFTGAEKETDPQAEGNDEKTDPAECTYYRIGKGTHYHSLDCYLIQKNVQMMSESRAVEQGYKKCSRCGGGQGTVWVTPGGERYHVKGCSALFPDVAPLTAEEWKSGVYTPCAICQSDGGWFS